MGGRRGALGECLWGGGGAKYSIFFRAEIPTKVAQKIKILVDVSDIFYFFSSGGGRVGRGGRSIFIEIPRRGGGFEEGRGAGKVSAANWGIWGGGAKYFFSGPKCPPRNALLPVP